VLEETSCAAWHRRTRSFPCALEYNTVDYAKSAQIMQRGYQAANARARLLEAFALDDADWQAHQQVREARKRNDVPTPQFIEVQGTNAHEATDVTRYVKRFQSKPSIPQNWTKY